MLMPGRHGNTGDYRYAFNGMEKDPEIKGDGNSYTTEFRQYDPRLGRWLSLDPLMAKFANQSPYHSFSNNPIVYTDPRGLESTDWIKNKKTGEVKWDSNVTGADNTPSGYEYMPKGTTYKSTLNGKSVTITLGVRTEDDKGWGFKYNDPEDAIPQSTVCSSYNTDVDFTELLEQPITEPNAGKFMLANSEDEWKELQDAWGNSDDWKRFADIINDIAFNATLFAGGEAVMALEALSLNSNVVRESSQFVDEVVEGTNVVYHSVENGVTQYVGITNNLARRAAEHLASKGISIEPLMTGLSRADARSVEQALIEIHQLSKNGGTLINRINSIAKSNPIYAESVKRGFELLKSIAY